jgi:glycosyltransferase involved in cell wall biosynthesis
VPAHNEEAVIAANLRLLLATALPGELDVIVVPNGCTDGTATAARGVGVRVVETATPGKPHAIRLGDAHCATFPRIYLDADVELTTDGVRALVSACDNPAVLACAPAPTLDLTGAGWFIRRVHKVHEQLIAPRRALAGAGAYVLTRTGYERVFPMPDVISDDGWVHGSFAPGERTVVADARSVVRPARTVRAHLNRRLRVRRGNRQLAALGRAAPEGRLGLGAVLELMRSRKVSPLDTACYLSIQALDRLITVTRRRHELGWGSDGSTRSSATAGEPGATSTHAA